MEPSLKPSFAPVAANAPVVTVQATQTVAGVTSDSPDFRTAFESAVMSLLPTGSTVTIVSVTIIDVRHRQLLTKAVSVVYTVQTTAPASAITSSLSSGTTAMTAVLQQSYPAASVAAPTVIAVANPTAAPTTGSPVTSNSNASTTNIIPGAAVGSVLGFLAILALISYRRHQLEKKKKQVAVDVVEQDNEQGDGLDDAVDPKSTTKPVRNSMEEMPFGENDNKIAIIESLNQELEDIGGLDHANALIEEGRVNEEMVSTGALPSPSAVSMESNVPSPSEVEKWPSPKQSAREEGIDDDGKGNDEGEGEGDVAAAEIPHIFDFLRFPLQVQGWFSSKFSSKKSIVEDNDSNGGGDGDSARVDNPHLLNFVRSPLEMQGWFSSNNSSKKSSVAIGDMDGEHEFVGKSHIASYPLSITSHDPHNKCTNTSTHNILSETTDVNGVDQQPDEVSPSHSSPSSPPVPITPRDNPVVDSPSTPIVAPTSPHSTTVSGLREKFLRRRVSSAKGKKTDIPGTAGGGPGESPVPPDLTELSGLQENSDAGTAGLKEKIVSRVLGDAISSGVRQKFLRRRMRSENSDTDDDDDNAVLDLKLSMKPTAMTPTVASNVVIPVHTITSPLNEPSDPSTSTIGNDNDDAVVKLKSSMKPTAMMPITASNAVIPVHTITSPLNSVPSMDISDTIPSDTPMEILPILAKSPVSQKIMLPPLAPPALTPSPNTLPSNLSPRLSPFVFKTPSSLGSPLSARNTHLTEWIAQAREWKEYHADGIGSFFYQKKTTREWQWEAPSSGYIRVDTRLVLQDGSVIDDPVLKAPTATNDASTMLSQMKAWKSEEDDSESKSPYVKNTLISSRFQNDVGGLGNHSKTGDGQPPSTLRETFLRRRRGRSEKSDTTDDGAIVDLKPSRKPSQKNTTPATATNSVLVALFTDSSPPKNATDTLPSATSPNPTDPEYHL